MTLHNMVAVSCSWLPALRGLNPFPFPESTLNFLPRNLSYMLWVIHFTLNYKDALGKEIRLNDKIFLELLENTCSFKPALDS